jgi:hypothetical protein
VATVVSLSRPGPWTVKKEACQRRLATVEFPFRLFNVQCIGRSGQNTVVTCEEGLITSSRRVPFRPNAETRQCLVEALSKTGTNHNNPLGGRKSLSADPLSKAIVLLSSRSQDCPKTGHAASAFPLPCLFLHFAGNPTVGIGQVHQELVKQILGSATTSWRSQGIPGSQACHMCAVPPLIPKTEALHSAQCSTY